MIRPVFLVVLLCPASPVSAQSEAGFAAANAQADQQGSSEATAAYAKSWAQFNNQHRLDERDGCYFMADGELTQILQIDKTGKVVAYFADKDNGRSRCWRNTYMGVEFPQPPFAPYWHRLVMH